MYHNKSVDTSNSDNNTIFKRIKKVIRHTSDTLTNHNTINNPNHNHHTIVSSINQPTVEQVVAERIKRNSPPNRLHIDSPTNQQQTQYNNELQFGSQLTCNNPSLIRTTNNEQYMISSPRSRNNSNYSQTNDSNNNIQVTELPTTLPDISLPPSTPSTPIHHTNHNNVHSTPTISKSITTNTNNINDRNTSVQSRRSWLNQLEDTVTESKNKLFGKSPNKLSSINSSQQSTPVTSPAISPEPTTQVFSTQHARDSPVNIDINNTNYNLQQPEVQPSAISPRPLHVLLSHHSNDRMKTPSRHSSVSPNQSINPNKNTNDPSTTTRAQQRTPSRHQRAIPFMTPHKDNTIQQTQLDGKHIHDIHTEYQHNKSTVVKPSLVHTVMISTFYYLLYVLLHTQIQSSVLCLILPYATWLLMQYIASYSTYSPHDTQHVKVV